MRFGEGQKDITEYANFLISDKLENQEIVLLAF